MLIRSICKFVLSTCWGMPMRIAKLERWASIEATLMSLKSSAATKLFTHICCVVQMAMAGGFSPVSSTIGAVQAAQGQGQGNELLRELSSLVEAGMDVACFDLSQGLLEQHLDLADHLAEVGRAPTPIHELAINIVVITYVGL